MAGESISAIPAFASARCSTEAASIRSPSVNDVQKGRSCAFLIRHRLVSSPSRLVALSAFTSVRAITNSRRFRGCNPLAVGNPLPNKQLSQCLAYRLHRHHSHLPSAVSVGIDPNENGRTYATQPLPPRGKTND